jgi:hypothetical protein
MWEYCYRHFRNSDENSLEELNRLGKDDWELVGFQSIEDFPMMLSGKHPFDGVVFVFKRCTEAAYWPPLEPAEEIE